MLNLLDYVDKCKDIGNDPEIKVISICSMFTAIWPDYFSNFNTDTGNKREKEFTSALKSAKSKIHYYAAPREKFFIYKAVEQAEKLGVKYVIVEDMS